jgi:hypothetical protein
MPYYYYKFDLEKEIAEPPRKRRRKTSRLLIIKAEDIFEAQIKAETHIKKRKTYNNHFESYELILSHIS